MCDMDANFQRGELEINLVFSFGVAILRENAFRGR